MNLDALITPIWVVSMPRSWGAATAYNMITEEERTVTYRCHVCNRLLPLLLALSWSLTRAVCAALFNSPIRSYSWTLSASGEGGGGAWSGEVAGCGEVEVLTGSGDVLVRLSTSVSISTLKQTGVNEATSINFFEKAGRCILYRVPC